MKRMKKMLIILIFSTLFFSFTTPSTSAKYAQDVEFAINVWLVITY